MLRETQRFFERRYNEKGQALCLVPICNDLASSWKNGNPRNYCSNHNAVDMRKFTNWQGFCRMIIERDGNKCTECGDSRDMIEIERNEKIYNWGVREPFRKKEDYRKVKSLISNLEVHHKKEVSAGGDMWDPDNCQTLCYHCHKKKTAHFNSHKNSIKAIHSGIQRTLVSNYVQPISEAKPA